MAKVLVTGANGHLGNNVVRYLVAQGETVVAGMRNLNNAHTLTGIDCDIKAVDLFDIQSLDAALQGVEILYQVAAVFKRWSKNPEQDIIEPNMKGTENILHAAARAGVKKVVYVSSIAALDDHQLPFDGSTWNPAGKESPYPYSKTKSEQLAHELGKKLGLDISFILPSAIMGPHFDHATPTIKGLFEDPFNKKSPFNPNFSFLMVDARDVAKACYLAAQKGRNGGRYIISLDQPLGFGEIFSHLQQQFPARKYKVPFTISKLMLLVVSWLMENIARLTGGEPLLSVADTREYYGTRPTADASAARKELGWIPMSLGESLNDTFLFLDQRANAQK